MREKVARYDMATALGYRPAGVTIVNLEKLGTISAADGLDYFVVPYKGEIVHAQMSLSSTGGTSGTNTAELNLNGVAQFTGSIDWNASVKYKDLGVRAIKVKKGDILHLDINAVATSGSPADMRLKLLLALS